MAGATDLGLGSGTGIWHWTAREGGMSLDVVGKLARVTAEITPGHLGEVMIEVRQGTERFLARGADKDATIPRYTQVLVVGSLGGRTVEVSPTDVMRLPR
jgi:hypothetical protein